MVPISIEIVNFFSHRHSFIDFSQFNSALLIGNVDGDYNASNGSGKSGLMEALLWSLFNKSRAAAMDDIIFWGEKTCKVVFVFQHKGEVYKVIRKRDRMLSTSTVGFYRQTLNNTWEDISGSTSSLTNSRISSVIKLNYDTFMNSAYFRQNDISEFAESDAGTRKKILKSIIDLSKWDFYEKQIKDKIKDIKTELKIFGAQLSDFDEAVVLLKSTESQLVESQKQLEDCILEAAEKKESLDSLKSKYEDMKKTLDTDSWDKAVSEIAADEKELQEISVKISSSKKMFQKYMSKADFQKTELTKLDMLIRSLEEDPEVDQKLEERNNQLILFQSKYASAVEYLKMLEDRAISSGQCYVCKQEVNDNLYQQLLEEHNEDVEKHTKAKVYYANKVKEAGSKIKELKIVKSKQKTRQESLAKIKTLDTEIKIMEDRIQEIVADQELLDSKSAILKNNINLNKELLDLIRDDSFNILHERILCLSKEKDVLGSTINQKNMEIGILTEKVNNLQQSVSKMKDAHNEVVNRKKRLVVLENLSKLLGKNGIQTILLNAVIEDLEKTANDILVSICNEPFVIYLDTQRIGADGVSIVDTLDLRVKKDGIVQNFKSLSGGEKFRVSLALRIALSEISSRHGGSSLEFLLLDEINSALDKQGTESLFTNVIGSLEKKYKILVITHNEMLKGCFNNIIDVSKINGESYTTFLSI